MRTDTTKPIVALRNFANAPKNSIVRQTSTKTSADFFFFKFHFRSEAAEGCQWIIESRRFEAAVTDHSFPHCAEVRNGYALMMRKWTISSFGRTDL